MQAAWDVFYSRCRSFAILWHLLLATQLQYGTQRLAWVNLLRPGVILHVTLDQTQPNLTNHVSNFHKFHSTQPNADAMVSQWRAWH